MKITMQLIRNIVLINILFYLLDIMGNLLFPDSSFFENQSLFEVNFTLLIVASILATAYTIYKREVCIQATKSQSYHDSISQILLDHNYKLQKESVNQKIYTKKQLFARLMMLFYDKVIVRIKNGYIEVLIYNGNRVKNDIEKAIG